MRAVHAIVFATSVVIEQGAVLAATRAPEGWSFAWLAEPGRPVKLTATDLD